MIFELGWDKGDRIAWRKSWSTSSANFIHIMKLDDDGDDHLAYSGMEGGGYPNSFRFIVSC